jgi:hypothetical protein
LAASKDKFGKEVQKNIQQLKKEIQGMNSNQEERMRYKAEQETKKIQEE